MIDPWLKHSIYLDIEYHLNHALKFLEGKVDVDGCRVQINDARDVVSMLLDDKIDIGTEE